VTPLTAFITSPSVASALVAAIALALVWLLLDRSARIGQPPPLEVHEPVSDQPDDPPAVASLITSGFVVTPHAAVATLLDLAARDWLSVDELGDDVVVLTNRRGKAGDQLLPYEQQVLNHVHKLTAGTVSGVSGAGIQMAGLRLSQRWWRRFQKAVVIHSRRAGYSRRRWDALALAAPVVIWAIAALIWWRAAVGGEDAPINESMFERSLSVLVLLGLLWLGARLLGLVRSHDERPTPDGLKQAQLWLRVRRRLEEERIGRYSAVMSQHGDRRLAYAAAMGLADSATAELPVVPEDSHVAWSDATGSARIVRVNYPIRPAYGRHPLMVLAVGTVLTVGCIALQQFLLRVSRSEALESLYEDFPDQTDLIRNVSLTLAAIIVVPIVLSIWTVLAGLVDSVLSVNRRGLVVRARRPERIVPLAKLLGPLVRRDRFALYVAVDDGSSSTIVAWLANERTAVPQGARAHIVASPILGYIRRSEPIGTSRQ
jgi:hypothetical protein